MTFSSNELNPRYVKLLSNSNSFIIYTLLHSHGVLGFWGFGVLGSDLEEFGSDLKEC